MKGFTGRTRSGCLTVVAPAFAALALFASTGCEEGHGTRPDARVEEGPPDADVVDADTRMHTITVRVLHPTATATGTITSDPPGINDCAGDCTAEFPHGAVVRFDATGGTFGGWTGAGCSGIGPCFKVVDGDATVEGVFWNVSFTGVNRTFTTSRVYTPGLLGSVGAADAACQAEAEAVGYGGTWIAWISSSASPAIDRLGTASGWVRPDGLPFALTATDLLSGKILYPSALDERGFPLLEDFLDSVTVTGTLQDGSLDTGGFCAGWTSQAANFQLGNPFGTSALWTQFGQRPCDYPAHLLCLQTDHSTPPVNPTAGGGPWRNAFISSAALPASSGVANFDFECQTEAGMAGLSGTYQALISTSTMTAASRFPNPDAGPPWRRRDGALLATTGGHLFDSPWLTGLNVTADGTTYVTDFGWTGSGPDLREPPYETCQDWTSSSPSDHAQAGWANIGGPWAFSWAYFQCDNLRHVFCFEI